MQLHVMPVHHKIKNIYFSFLFLCFLLFLLFWCELLCRIIIIRNVHLLSNIIELDGTLLVPLKQPKLHLIQPSTIQTRIRQGLSIYLYTLSTITKVPYTEEKTTILCYYQNCNSHENYQERKTVLHIEFLKFCILNFYGWIILLKVARWHIISWANVVCSGLYLYHP